MTPGPDPARASRRPLLVVGDALLDRDVEGDVERLSPDAPVPVLDERRMTARPGGAGLAAMLAAADGHEVTLVTALAPDAAGGELAAALRAGGVEVIDLGLDGDTSEKVRFRSGGRSLLRLDRGGVGGQVGASTAVARAAVEWAEAVLVSDYGRGVAAEPGVRDALARLARRAPLVWDPHPRGPAPVPGAALATPNEREAVTFASDGRPHDDALAATVALAESLVRRWRSSAVCITRGSAGAVMAAPPAPPLAAPARAAGRGDPCGAGDRFSATAAGLLSEEADVHEAVVAAVAAATDFVARGGAAAARLGRGAPRGDTAAAAAGAAAATLLPDPLEVAGLTRSRGGTVVATGGCFDLLHTGHVRTLEAARALGDCLIVCLNSDASVRRLKGPGRPLVPEADRAAVLLALECVDAVTIFGEETPAKALERLRPDVFAKGGDYAAADLPERATLERLGGRAVILPYLEGHSTTRLIEGVEGSAAG